MSNTFIDPKNREMLDDWMKDYLRWYFKPIRIPLLKRAFPGLIASEMLSVQPMVTFKDCTSKVSGTGAPIFDFGYDPWYKWRKYGRSPEDV